MCKQLNTGKNFNLTKVGQETLNKICEYVICIRMYACL